MKENKTPVQTFEWISTPKLCNYNLLYSIHCKIHMLTKFFVAQFVLKPSHKIVESVHVTKC